MHTRVRLNPSLLTPHPVHQDLLPLPCSTPSTRCIHLDDCHRPIPQVRPLQHHPSIPSPPPGVVQLKPHPRPPCRAHTQSHPTLRKVPTAPPEPPQPLAMAPCHVLTSPPSPSPINGIPRRRVDLDIPVALPPSAGTHISKPSEVRPHRLDASEEYVLVLKRCRPRPEPPEVQGRHTHPFPLTHCPHIIPSPLRTFQHLPHRAPRSHSARCPSVPIRLLILT